MTLSTYHGVSDDSVYTDFTLMLVYIIRITCTVVEYTLIAYTNTYYIFVI